MKVVHQICCGLDVHKDIVVATIASTDTANIITTDNANSAHKTMTYLVCVTGC